VVAHSAKMICTPSANCRLSLQNSVMTQPSKGNQQESSPALKHTGLYGLPCVKCRQYYDAELRTCPICGCAQRISAQLTIPTRSRGEKTKPQQLTGFAGDTEIR